MMGLEMGGGRGAKKENRPSHSKKKKKKEKMFSCFQKDEDIIVLKETR